MKDLNHRMIGFVPSTCQLKALPAEASIVLVHKLYTNGPLMLINPIIR